jgi:hypothetical protein
MSRPAQNLPAPVPVNPAEFGPVVRAQYEQMQALKDQIAPRATDGELLLFARVSQDLDLSWHKRQIYLLPYWDNTVGRYVHRHQVSIEGRRTIAYRTGRCIGNPGPEWAGERAHSPDGPCKGTGEINGKRCHKCEFDWLEAWDDEGPPYVARSLVYVRDFVVPVKGIAPFREFCQTYRKDGRQIIMPKWEEMGAHMLGKCAESLALRRAFPEVDAAVGYAGGITGDALLDPDDREILNEAEAPDSPAPTRANVAPEPAALAAPVPPFGPENAPAPQQNSERRRPGRPPRARNSWEPPMDYYDNLPEAGGVPSSVPDNAPEAPVETETETETDADPGRPFE